MKPDLTLKNHQKTSDLRIFALKALFVIGLASPILAISGEAGTALKADTLRATPFADAKSVGTLSKNDAVDILAKKGAWLQVKTTKSTGWVRLLSVKRGGVSSSNQVKGLADVASGRAGTGKVVSTTGIRGLSAEELKTAQFNETEMKKLESYTLTASDGQKFATAGGLTASKLPYFTGAK
ncbi:MULTISPECIES: SH3 domain-containing protein [Methylotenera]|uniref:SH3 domain-containing protein n=1 Tax=Methylotenera TaxID=359407 RepID=UPI000372BB6E|nr:MULTISPECIES: SH3 domain-containing protein [Methylotenera]